MDAVLYRVDDRIATFTINRPERRNAVDEAVVEAMTAALDRFEGDESVWLGVLTGSGEAAFCAGADLGTISRGGSIWPERGGFAGFVRRPRTKPVIAAVNGHAMGGGFELVLACDLAVAVETATFGLPEVRRGIIAGSGGLFRLPRLVPPRVATELILTGQPIGAARALEIGVLNAVVPRDQLMPAVHELAGRVLESAPLAVRESLRALREVRTMEDEAAFDLCAEARGRVIGTQDAQEGMRAFLEKRPPRWRGA
ncbi:MAG TPA: enoyl-CoA hydratase-related protein [Candidatus Binatia bacterium]|nr:enoyl-CoA hydratase-related protein [Candidatus Binatia bacterium]